MSDRYQELDLPFYHKEIAPMLPERILDFHTHIWKSENWSNVPWQGDTKGGQYMVTVEDYTAETLLTDGNLCFPDRDYHAVCFGWPAPTVDWRKDTDFVANSARQNDNLHPLVICGKDLAISRADYEQVLDPFYGFKVCLNWQGNDYGQIRVEDMISEEEIAIANERRLIVLLHVPRSGRLVDPEVQKGVRWLSQQCPNAQIVIAHCGRCYIPSEMKAAINCLSDLENVSMDTSMVMDPIVLQIAINHIGSERLVFGTDFPVAIMRGRRVQVMDHWVDVVLPGYAQSAFRVSGDDIHATFMTWEIVLAIRWAAEMTGLSESQIHGIFWDNGMRMLKQVVR